MKVTVDLDCTPEEARRFLGLPDLTALHDAYLDRMRTAIEGGVTPETIQAVLKSWSPMGDAGLTMWRTMFEQMGGGRGSAD